MTELTNFLMDDDLYSNIRGQILALDPVPPLDKIFNMVQQEENHKRMMRTRETEKTQLLRLLLHITTEPPPKCLVTGYLVPIAERLDTRSSIVFKLLDIRLDGK